VAITAAVSTLLQGRLPRQTGRPIRHVIVSHTDNMQAVAKLEVARAAAAQPAVDCKVAANEPEAGLAAMPVKSGKPA
jgi:hypothetical protein